MIRVDMKIVEEEMVDITEEVGELLLNENNSMDMIKKGFMKIDWVGVKKVLIHALIVGLGYLAMTGEQMITGHNFGAYQMFVMAINSVVIKFLQKFFGTYEVPVNFNQ